MSVTTDVVVVGAGMVTRWPTAGHIPPAPMDAPPPSVRGRFSGSRGPFAFRIFRTPLSRTSFYFPRCEQLQLDVPGGGFSRLQRQQIFARQARNAWRLEE
jgi:hypothetical protein